MFYTRFHNARPSYGESRKALRRPRDNRPPIIVISLPVVNSARSSHRGRFPLADMGSVTRPSLVPPARVTVRAIARGTRYVSKPVQRPRSKRGWCPRIRRQHSKRRGCRIAVGLNVGPQRHRWSQRRSPKTPAVSTWSAAEKRTAGEIPWSVSAGTTVTALRLSVGAVD